MNNFNFYACVQSSAHFNYFVKDVGELGDPKGYLKNK